MAIVDNKVNVPASKKGSISKDELLKEIAKILGIEQQAPKVEHQF